MGCRLLEPEALLADWRREPAPDSTRALGTDWVREGRSPVLRVPSVLIPSEHHYALNPAHPDFRRLEIRGEEPFSFDPRLWR